MRAIIFAMRGGAERMILPTAKQSSSSIHTKSACSSRMHSACTTCTTTSWSGVRMRTSASFPVVVTRLFQKAHSACCEEAVGADSPGTAALRSVPARDRQFMELTSDFALRWPHLGNSDGTMAIRELIREAGEGNPNRDGVVMGSGYPRANWAEWPT